MYIKYFQPTQIRAMVGLSLAVNAFVDNRKCQYYVSFVVLCIVVAVHFCLACVFFLFFFSFTLFAIAVTWQNSIQNGMGLCHRSIYIHLFWCLKMPKIYVRKEIRSSHAKAMGRGVCKCVNCFEIQRLLFLGWLRPTENDVCLCMKL